MAAAHEPEPAAAAEPPGAVVVHQYGLGAPFDWDDDCEAELRRQNALWNKLVEIERDHAAAFLALTAGDAVVAALTAELAALDAAIVAVIEERNRRRAAARTKAASGAADARLKALRPRRRELAAALAAARRTARAALAPQIAALTAARFAAVKAARNASGLYWGNYNAVCASYERGRAAVIKRRSSGRAELRFHRYDGSGRLTNQIQGGMAVAELFAGAHAQVQCAPLPDAVFAIGSRSQRDRLARSVLTVTVYTGRDAAGRRTRRTVRWPIMMHRPLPPDAVIKEVVVQRRKVGNAFRWRATFTCRVPDPAPAPNPPRSGAVVAVDLGWRRLNAGMRVATFMVSTGAQLSGDRAQFIVLPEALVGIHDLLDRLKSERANLHAAILPNLRAVPWREAPEALGGALASWRAIPQPWPHHTAILALAWRAHRDWQPLHWQAIEDWRKADKRLWLWEANARDKAQARRLDFYRNAARAVIAGAGTVILEDFDLAAAAAVEDNPLHAAARRQRVIAGVHELRQWIVNQATKAGVTVVRHKGVSTWLCTDCGTRLAPRSPQNLTQQCPACCHVFDQDVEACRNMLSAHQASAGVASE